MRMQLKWRLKLAAHYNELARPLVIQLELVLLSPVYRWKLEICSQWTLLEGRSAQQNPLFLHATHVASLNIVREGTRENENTTASAKTEHCSRIFLRLAHE